MSKYLTGSFIKAALRPYGVVTDEQLLAGIARHVELLLLWNQKVNLTRIVDPREVLERHFGESMFAVAAVPIHGGRLVDVGSGAGFPGLALKLAVPSLEVTLIEPNAKKAAFLHEVIRSLSLERVRVIRQRTEDIAAQGEWDWTTARAVGLFDELLRFARQALASKGKVVLWLGKEDAQRLALMPGWTWKPAIAVPKSENRCILVGYPD